MLALLQLGIVGQFCPDSQILQIYFVRHGKFVPTNPDWVLKS